MYVILVSDVYCSYIRCKMLLDMIARNSWFMLMIYANDIKLLAVIKAREDENRSHLEVDVT